ncbi:MAG: transporter substrate-binding domain-containing protein [Clostridia bacterium]|nr:transporter substrate-binding domain-containing protein [Clostridia bacterium]
MKRLIAITLALVMVLAFAACGNKPAADDKKTFTMGIDAEYPPFSYLGDDGEYAGFDVEVCKACCDLLGWDFEVFGVNWDEKLVQLDAKECDCVWSGMTILDSMKDAGYVISDPYFKNDQVILVKADSNIKSSADLAGKVVAVQLGTSGETLLNEELTDLTGSFKELVTCDSFLKCFAELEGGSVDAVVVDKPVAVARVAENSELVVLDEVLGTEEYGIAFRAGDEQMCADIQGAINKLVENGTYAKIAEKYPDIDAANLVYLSK